MLRETATYWPPAPADAFGGASSFASPAVIPCRWFEDAMQFMDVAGVGENLHAQVMVAYPVSAGGYLYRGTSTQDSPLDQQGSDFIRRVIQVETRRGDIATYKVLL